MNFGSVMEIGSWICGQHRPMDHGCNISANQTKMKDHHAHPRKDEKKLNLESPSPSIKTSVLDDATLLKTDDDKNTDTAQNSPSLPTTLTPPLPLPLTAITPFQIGLTTTTPAALTAAIDIIDPLRVKSAFLSQVCNSLFL